MTVVVGTAGHIDHGKTTLLRALTGIDADRLPEEQRRGMTIDVGYAYLTLPGGDELDFVDVPGHNRLVGNMLVGAGEIDAVLLVVAADDGPRAQTIEHLELLDALAVRCGVAVVTKTDQVGSDRVDVVVDDVRELLSRTALAEAPVLAVSAATGEGLDALRIALAGLAGLATPAPRRPPSGSGLPRLAIDRAFAVRGRGTVVTGTLRGGSVRTGDTLRLVPDDVAVRIREIQVHGRTVERAGPGRTALNLAGVGAGLLRRGRVLAGGPDVVATDRLLVQLRPPASVRTTGRRPTVPGDRSHIVVHLGTDQVPGIVSTPGASQAGPADGEVTALIRLERPIAAAIGDHFVLRHPSPGSTAAGGRVLDPLPPRPGSRRRATPDRLAALAGSAGDAVVAALVDLHGVLSPARVREATAGRNVPSDLLQVSGRAIAPDVAATLGEQAVAAVAEHHRANPLEPGLTAVALRRTLATALRRAAPVDREAADAAAGSFVDALVAAGRLARSGDRIHAPGRAPTVPVPLRAAMDRLVAALSSPTPPALAEAARAAGCPPDAMRSLESAGEIVRVADDLAFAAHTYARLEATAVALAATGPLSPAAYRDAVGSSRKYVVALLEEFGRRGLLARTADGHVPGPRAPDPAPSSR